MSELITVSCCLNVKSNSRNANKFLNVTRPTESIFKLKYLREERSSIMISSIFDVLYISKIFI